MDMVHEEVEQAGGGERKQFFYELQCDASQTKFTQENGLSGVVDKKKHPRMKFQQACRIKLVKVWFSAGCQNYVHLIGNLNDHQVIPSPDEAFDTGGIIGDDETFPFFINKSVKKGDVLEFFYKNSDTNDHTVGIYVEVEYLASKRKRVPEVVVREPIPEPEEEPTELEERTEAAYKEEVVRHDEFIPNPDELIDGLEHE